MRHLVVVALAVFVATSALGCKKLFRRGYAPAGAKCGASEIDRKRDPTKPGCASDAECKDGKNGHCVYVQYGPRPGKNDCIYDECFTDEECRSGGGPSGPCECGTNGATNSCAKGNCNKDGDCGGRTCAKSADFNCGRGWGSGYYCHTANDACTKDSDCAPRECRYDRNKERWACSGGVCME